MGETLDIALAGEALQLHADRALHWPARRRLLVADVHLGKDDAFRAAGIALPTGGARHDLDRLAALVATTGVHELWVLGDLLHGARPDARWRDDWRRFRERHAQLQIVLVEGNHDRSAARADLGIALMKGCVVDGPFAFAHAPSSAPATRPVGGEPRLTVCGHVHPVVRVPGLRGRFPAFVQVDHQLVLPAFSAFTGGWLIDRAHARHACLNGHLLDLGPVG
jgi:DNA ligase-associated metallophosphoesterase